MQGNDGGLGLPDGTQSHTAIETHVITNHMRCLRCGYDLYSCEIGGKCPECGHGIADANQVQRRLAETDIAPLARKAATALLGSTILAGLCPIAVFAALICDLSDVVEDLFGRDVPMLLLAASFGSYAVARVRAEWLMNRLMDRLGLDTDTQTRKWVWLGHGLAIASLLSITIVPWNYVHHYRISDQTDKETHLMIAIGGGLLMLCLVALRSVPIWRDQLALARQLEIPRTAETMAFIVQIKPIYEIIWLTACWMQFALVLSHLDRRLSVPFMVCSLVSFFGMFGFGLIWVPMLIATATLRSAIRARAPH